MAVELVVGTNMRGIGRKLIAAGFAAFVASCGSPTPYRGAYSELKLSADTYRITVAANSRTSEARAQNMAFYRAAELTLQAGFDRFVIVGGRGVRDIVVGHYEGDTLRAPKGEIVIRMVKQGDRDYADAHDARLIAEQLRAAPRELSARESRWSSA